MLQDRREQRPVQNVAAGFWELTADSLRVGKVKLRSKPMVVGQHVRECDSPNAEDCTSRASRLDKATTSKLASSARICLPEDTECCEQFPSQCGGPPPPPVIVPVTARFLFAPIGDSVAVPLRRVTITWSGPGLTPGSTSTDDGGYANVPCNASQNGSITLTASLTKATDLWISEQVTSVSAGATLTSQCFSTALYIYGWAEASVWEYTLRAVLGVRSVFGFNRPRIEIAYTDRFNPSVSSYRRTSDFIAFNPVDVNGSRGVFVAAHEFRHAVHAKLPTGLPNGNCPSPHYLHLPTNSTCAFTEGFANFISVVSSPFNNEFASLAEADSYRSGCGSASECEAVFAAMLLDLIDPVNYSDPDGYPDLIELPARHILDLFGSCSMPFEFRTFPGGQVIDIWTLTSANTGDTRRCLLNESPVFLGPVNGYDFWFTSRSLPWPNLTGAGFNNVLARLTR